jgi:hypothetical protein
MKNVLFVALLLAGFITACDNDDSPATPDSNTRVKIYMHDQPAEYQQVNIDVQSIEIKGEGNNETLNIGTYAGIYNLLDLQDGTLALLADTLITYGHISQVRLILGPNNTIMVDSVLHPLQTPSAQQSGLKIDVHEDLGALDSLVISLDFDAYESVTETGNGGYILHPVINLD